MKLYSIPLVQCSDDDFKTNGIEGYQGHEECSCKPITTCKWTQNLKELSDKLPKRNKLRKRVIQLLRNSICDFDAKTVHCCNTNGEVDTEYEVEASIDNQVQVPRQTKFQIEGFGL